MQTFIFRAEIWWCSALRVSDVMLVAINCNNFHITPDHPPYYIFCREMSPSQQNILYLFFPVLSLVNLFRFQTLSPPRRPPSRSRCRPGPTTRSVWSPGTRWVTPFPLATPRSVSPRRMSRTRTQTTWWAAATPQTTSSSHGRWVQCWSFDWELVNCLM